MTAPPPVNPHRITVALDRAKLFGPTADAKLGAVEPELDEWEAGRRQPTAAQLSKLAALANLPVSFFWLVDDEPPRIAYGWARVGRRCIPVVALVEPVPDEPQGTLL